MPLESFSPCALYPLPIMRTSSSFIALFRLRALRRQMTAKSTAKTIAPPTPPTTPPMMDFVDELKLPPLEEPLSAREVDCGEPVEVLANVLANVLPFSVMTVVTSTTEAL